MKFYKSKWFSLIEVIIGSFILGMVILATVILKSQILNQKYAILSSYKLIYLSDYVNGIIESTTPLHTLAWQKSYITISWNTVSYSSDEADKTWDLDFLKMMNYFLILMK